MKINMIKFNKVTKQFSDGTVAFSDLSFTVDEGDLTLITGPSGSGKTTVMRLLIKEYLPTQGEIVFEGKDIKDIRGGNVCQHRRKVGVAFQDYKLIPELNVWENIALPLYIKNEHQDEIEERVTDLLKLVELTEKGLMFPKQLSGGEAQRVSIARALATGPRLIFADEPTGNLDKTTSERIITLLKKINQLGTTLIIATHDPLVISQLKAKVINLGPHDVNQTSANSDQTENQEPAQSEKNADDIKTKQLKKKERTDKKINQKQDQKSENEAEEKQEDQKESKQKENEQQAADNKPADSSEKPNEDEESSQPDKKPTKQIKQLKEISAQELAKVKTKSAGFLKKMKASLKNFRKNKQSTKSRFVKEKRSAEAVSFEPSKFNGDLQKKPEEAAQSDSEK